MLLWMCLVLIFIISIIPSVNGFEGVICPSVDVGLGLCPCSATHKSVGPGDSGGYSQIGEAGSGSVDVCRWTETREDGNGYSASGLGCAIKIKPDSHLPELPTESPNPVFFPGSSSLPSDNFVESKCVAKENVMYLCIALHFIFQSLKKNNKFAHNGIKAAEL